MSLFSLLALLSMVLASLAAPTKETTIIDSYDCTRVKYDYIILVDRGSCCDFSAQIRALRTLGLGLLRQEGTRVGFCPYDNGGADCESFFNFDTLESSFLSKLTNLNNFGGNGNPYTAISQVMSFYNSTESKPRLILIQPENGNGGYEVSSRARDAGIEIFAIGLFPTEEVSHPTLSHHIFARYYEIPMAAEKLLRILRNQAGDSCYAWGFGQTHIQTFDGTLYDFAGVGDYYLFKTDSYGEDNFQVQVRQLTRPSNEDLRTGVTQIRAVSVTFQQVTFTVQYDPDEKLISYFVNGNEIRVQDFDFEESFWGWTTDHKYYGYNDIAMYVRKYSPENAYEIQIFDWQGSGNVTIVFSDYGSSVTVKPPGTSYGASSGLCGRFDSCSKNDLIKRDGTILDSSSDRRIQKYVPEFIEDWRITSHFESSFGLVGFEEYLPSDDWKPFTSSKGHKNADVVCGNLPEVLQDACKFDVGARKHIFASFLSQHIMTHICGQYCQQKGLGFQSIFDVAKQCKNQCLSYEYDINFHQKYNSTYLPPPPVTFRGGENSAIFKPVGNIGGSYVYQLKSNDRCLSLERNITFSITCDEPPVVNAYSYFDVNEEETNIIHAPLSEIGVSRIYLRGSVSNTKSDNIRVSWRIVNATVPQYEDLEDLEYYIEEANIISWIYPNSLTPVFIPQWVGIFELEMVVSDGCQVARANISVVVNCTSCERIARIESFQKNSWQKYNGQTGRWEENIYNQIQTYSKNEQSQYDYEIYSWSLISKDGAMVKKVDYNNYEVYKPISPRTSLKTTTETDVSTSSPSNTQTDNGFPFSQSVIPYLVNELRVVDTTITWTQTTTTITEEVFIPEKIEEVCEVYLESPTNSQTRFLFNEAVDLDENLAKCTGYYTVEAVVRDGCYDVDKREVKDTAILHLDCGLPPRVFLTCNTHSEYQYNGVYFDEVYLDGSATYDPRPSADSNGYQLIYSWDLVSVPPGSSYSTGDLGENDRDYYFIPDIKGTYVLRLTASNQCNKESALITVEATCVAPPVILGTQVENAKLIFDGSDGSPAFVFNVTATHEFQNNLDYTWSVVSSPQIPSEFSGLVSEPDFYGSFEDPTLSVYYGGNYVVKVAVSDGCQLPVNQTVNIEYVCPGSLNIVIAPIPATIEYDYDVNSFPQVVLNASQSTALDGGAGYTPSTFFAWYVIAAPIEGLPTTPIGSGDTESFNLPLDGKYSFRLVFSDYCLYSFSELSFTLVCPHNPVPVPVLFEPTPSEIFVGNTTFFGDNSQDDKIDNIEWELVVSPQNVDLGTTYGGKNVTYVPSLPGVYIFQATGEDGCKTASANITFTVKCIPVDYSPSAALGTPTSTYSKGKFSRVEMYDLGTGLGSTDPDSLEYRWIVTSAPLGSIYYPRNELNITEETTSYNYTNDDVDNSTFTIVTERVVFYRREIRYVEIRNADYPTRTFASCFYPDLPGTYRVKLTISKSDIDNICDSRNSTELSIQAVCNNAPTINVNDQTVTLTPNKYTRVNLDASATIDADGDALTYSWTVDPLQGDNKHLEQLTTYSSPIASFIVYAQGTYSIQLTVSDGCQNVTRVVTINANCPLDDDVVEDKKKKKEDLDTFAFTFDRKDIAFTEFEFINKTATDLCTGEYSWELIDYKIVGSGVFKIEPFSTFALVILFALVQLFN